MSNLSFVFFWVLIEVFMKIDKDDMEKTRSTKICVMIYFWKKKKLDFLFYFMEMMKDDRRWRWGKKKKKVNKLGVGDTL